MDRRDFCLTAGAALAAAPAAARGGDADAALARTLARLYATALAENPELATQLGVDRGAHAASKAMLHHAAPADAARRRRIAADEAAALRRIDRAALSPAARIDLDAVLYDRTALARAGGRFAYGGDTPNAPYVVSQIDGAYVSVPDFLATQHGIATAADCEAYLARLAAFARLLDEESERVRRDAGLGVIPPDFALRGAVAQLRLLRVPAGRSTLVSALADRARAAGIAGDWAARAGAVHERRVLPALDRQATLLEGLLPRATHDAGVWRLPDGEAFYAEALRAQTSSDLSADEVHRIGLDLTRSLQAQADAAFRRMGFAQGSVADRYAAFFRDPANLYPDSDEGRAREIAALNRLVAEMETRLPRYFGTLPKARLAIRRIPPASEGGQSTHYSPASLDGTRPGIYWLNMRDIGEVPFFDMPTTTFHEGLPGHHLQITLQNQAPLPDARKILFFNGYVEGWALYAEQLAAEMGAFDGHPAWTLGYIHDALLRAGRLVTDTGIHAKRWSREQAVAVLHDTDGDPPALCGQEIERYACWPGQACGYMIGKVTMLRLRDRARAALGPRFDIRRFHDAVLLSGAMPLAVLETRIDGFIADERQRAG